MGVEHFPQNMYRYVPTQLSTSWIVLKPSTKILIVNLWLHSNDEESVQSVGTIVENWRETRLAQQGALTLLNIQKKVMTIVIIVVKRKTWDNLQKEHTRFHFPLRLCKISQTQKIFITNSQCTTRRGATCFSLYVFQSESIVLSDRPFFANMCSILPNFHHRHPHHDNHYYFYDPPLNKLYFE